MKKALFLLSLIVVFSCAKESIFYDENSKYLVKFAKAKESKNYIPPTNPKIEIFLHLNDKNRSIYEVQKSYMELFTYDAAWNKNRLFLHYSYEDKSGKKYWDNGGVFDTKTSNIICKDSFKINGNLRDIGWINDKIHEITKNSTKKIKRDINGFTLFITPFSKNIDKLAVALDMKENEFGKNSSTVGEFSIFDINGNKIGKKVAPKASKKSDTIKLLD